MPRYFVHVLEGGDVIEHDSEGVELVNGGLQTGEWQQIFERVLREEEWPDELVEVLEFQVVDQSGRTAVVVPFRSLLAGSSA